MRNAMTAPASTNQPGNDRRGNHRPWVKNHSTSMATDRAQSSPITVLLYPRESR